MARLAQVAEVQSGLALDSGRRFDGTTSQVPYLRVANVQDGALDLTDVKTVEVDEGIVRRHSLRVGDVLMTEGGDPDKLGRGAVWTGQVDPCLHQNHVFAVRPDARVLDAEFLSLLTRSTYGRAYFEMTATKTTGIASTSASKIGSFRVPVPDVADQRSLVASVQCQVAWIDELTDTLTQQIGLLRELRQALITAAVAGELDVA